jgi:glycine cleavage system H protein
MADSQSRQNGKSVNHVNPEGASNCIWVDAGLVSYKLCDRDFECEDCQFDQVMRQESRRSSKTPTGSQNLAQGEESLATSSTYRDALTAIVRGFLSNSISSTLMSDRLYSKNHVWIKQTGDDNYRIGLDKYVASLFSDAWSLILPQTGSVYRRGAPLSWIILEDGTVVVRSPLGGKISKSNFQLRESPSLLNSDPYEAGWICEVSEVEHKDVESIFFNNSDAKALYDNQFLDLGKTIVSDLEHKSDHVGMTMMDGGTKLKNLNDILGPGKYVSILKRLLSSSL